MLNSNSLNFTVTITDNSKKNVKYVKKMLLYSVNDILLLYQKDESLCCPSAAAPADVLSLHLS